MIHYELKCAQGHIFQAWFRDSATFERQAAQGEVSCAICGDTRVARAPMAPNVVTNRGRNLNYKDATSAPHPQPPREAVEAVPVAAMEQETAHAKVTALLKEMRTKIEKNCDYVGNRFAEEVRKIHYGEAKARGIYGEADASEASSLHEEGIKIARIPWLPLDN